MKTITLLIISLLAPLAPVWSQAPDGLAPAHAEPREASPHKGKNLSRGNEERLLQQLLSMSRDELVQLRQMLQRIEKMSPEEKEGLSRRLKKMAQLDPGKIRSARRHYQSIPRETREAMHRRWDAMTSEEREAWRRRLHGMTQEERQNLFQTEGFLPGPPQPPAGGAGRAPLPPREAPEEQ